MSEMSPPPASRVVSVGALRSLNLDADLEEFVDETLAEIQLVASRVTDEGAMVLVSIVIETDSQRTYGHAEVPLKWFEDQIRMRSLLNIPADIATINHPQGGENAGPSAKKKMTSRVAKKKVAPRLERIKVMAQHLSAIGLQLGEIWSKKTRQTNTLKISTIAWINLVHEHDRDLMHLSVDEIRVIVVREKVSRNERRQIANFCKATSEVLHASAS